MHRFVRFAVTTAAALTLAGTVAATPASAAPAHFPTTLQLPDGFQPEGIAIGGAFAYFGSRATGQIIKVSLVDGSRRELSPAVGTASLGMKIDSHGRLFVSGGGGGDARVVDLRTGKVLAHYQFAEPGTATFINDVALTHDAAYFTDSRQAKLFKVPLGLRSGFSTVPLTGDFVLTPEVNNANGIVRTPDGKGLIIVQSNTGFLFRVDPRSGVTRQIDVEPFPNGDGLLIIDRTLYVVQNVRNTIAVVKLDKRATTGVVKQRITDPRFDVPTTVAPFHGRLYLPNARFSTPPTPTTTYTANAVDRP